MGQLAGPILLRLSQGLFVALGISTLTFCLLVSMPGDLALKIALAQFGEDGLTGERVEMVRRESGLGQPTTRLYLEWLGRVLRFDLGRSMVTGEPVLETIGYHLRFSLQLAAAALVFSLVIAFPAGIFSGLRPGSAVDLLSAAFSSLVSSVPGFVLGAGLIIIFSVKLMLLPAAGFRTPGAIVLPAATLGLSLAAVSCRIVRAAVVEVKDSFYLLFARLKGLSGRRVFLGHGVRNGAVPVVTFLALQFAHVLDGVVVLENLFNWPGIGFLLLESIRGRDLTMIQGVTLVAGLTYVGINLAADLACAWIDPRRRAGGGVL